MNSSLSGIVSTFQELREKEDEFVLATIVDTKGSTYRKAGARLLITRAGKFYGLLGGGCFEADLLEHAQAVFENKTTYTVFYDMRGPEDLVWGLGLGCNGAVKIRLEYVSAENNYEPVITIQQGLVLKQKCVVVTVCESAHPSLRPDQHYLISFDKDSGELELPSVILEFAIKTLYSGTCSLISLEVEGHSIEFFMAPVMPPLQLLVIGGGPDSIPVLNTACLLGWDVTIVDYRDSYSNPDNFPTAIRVIKSTPEDLKDHIDVTGVDAVVLMTHKYEYDLRYLKNFVTSTVPYIGLLGPTARKHELLRSLEDITVEFTDRVYGPVGLNLGGELPEEIALSLIAEIQAVVQQRPGGHLSEISANNNKISAADLSIVILAAGGSSRFGALKQLLEYEGQSFLKRAVGSALELHAKEVLVVHGLKATKCQREISSYDVVNVINNNWKNGLSSSLVLALKSASAETKAILVMLCDQPLINCQQLELLIEKWKQNPDKIIASAYADTVGVPAIIPSSYFDEIKKLKGDAGAKLILSGHSEDLLTVAIPDAEVDIDTEKDFAELLVQKHA